MRKFIKIKYARHILKRKQATTAHEYAMKKSTLNEEQSGKIDNDNAGKKTKHTLHKNLTLNRLTKTPEATAVPSQCNEPTEKKLTKLHTKQRASEKKNNNR